MALNLASIWEYRDLLYFLVWRDIKVRYKQTVLGIGWVILQPVVSTVVFTVVFGILTRVPSGTLPYPVFAFAGLLAWNYFSGVVSRAGISLLSNAQLITKVYFPRLIVPLSSAITGLVDLTVSFLVFIPFLLIFGLVPSPAMLALPFFVLLGVGAALGVSLWLAALNVRYRDVNYLLPFLVQIWMYATPVVYPSTLIPAHWRILFGINPMVGVVEGFRLALTGQGDVPIELLIVSSTVMLLILISGAIFFRQTERTFADIV